MDNKYSSKLSSFSWTIWTPMTYWHFSMVPESWPRPLPLVLALTVESRLGETLLKMIFSHSLIDCFHFSNINLITNISFIIKWISFTTTNNKSFIIYFQCILFVVLKYFWVFSFTKCTTAPKWCKLKYKRHFKLKIYSTSLEIILVCKENAIKCL